MTSRRAGGGDQRERDLGLAALEADAQVSVGLIGFSSSSTGTNGSILDLDAPGTFDEIGNFPVSAFVC